MAFPFLPSPVSRIRERGVQWCSDQNVSGGADKSLVVGLTGIRGVGRCTLRAARSVSACACRAGNEGIFRWKIVCLICHFYISLQYARGLLQHKVHRPTPQHSFGFSRFYLKNFLIFTMKKCIGIWIRMAEGVRGGRAVYFCAILQNFSFLCSLFYDGS